jgi:hypothetical protein
MRFRIIKDQFNGYEVQHRAWYHFKWQQWQTSSHWTPANAERQVQLLRKLLRQGRVTFIEVKRPGVKTAAPLQMYRHKQLRDLGCGCYQIFGKLKGL